MSNISDTLYKIQEKGFKMFIYISYFLLFLTVVGLSQYAPQYIKEIDYYVKIYVCLFLIIRFNPFQNIQFTELDRKVAFSAGLFILTTTAFTQYFEKISSKTSKYVRDKITSLNN
jgi:hypothetical protein